MTRRKSYDIIRIPSNDWNNIAETVSLDGSYSEEIKNEIWSALENVRSLSDPWVVLQIKDGVSGLVSHNVIFMRSYLNLLTICNSYWASPKFLSPLGAKRHALVSRNNGAHPYGADEGTAADRCGCIVILFRCREV